jgi:hypothetical protein
MCFLLSANVCIVLWQGGLGGLLLRLAQDGHGQVQLIGPQGTAAFGHSLRHIFRWRHPKVCLLTFFLSFLPVHLDNHARVFFIILNFCICHPGRVSLCLQRAQLCVSFACGFIRELERFCRFWSVNMGSIARFLCLKMSTLSSFP